MSTPTCRICKAPIMWARTVASESGTGGKPMPLDPEPNDDGNVAVRQTGPNRYVARVLKKGESHDTYAEKRHMPHAATCAGSARNIGAEAEEFLKSVADGGTQEPPC